MTRDLSRLYGNAGVPDMTDGPPPPPNTFPTYEVPAIARERFPGFDPADPATWPEPEKCTEGRPWGLDAYGSLDGPGRDAERLWELYLNGRLRACRNRWKDERYRMCGTHLNPYLDQRFRDERRRRTEERRLQHVDLARQLGAHGIVADGQASGVLLQADAVETLLRILDEAVRRAGGTIAAGVHLIEVPS